MKNKIERSIQIHFRVTQKEYKTIKEKAAESGLSISEFSRRILMDGKVLAAPPVDFYTLLWQIKRVGSNLDQLLRKLNAFGIAYSLDLERCEDDIHEMRRLMIESFITDKGSTNGSN